MELILLAAAGFTLFRAFELFSPWTPPLWLLPVLLLASVRVASYIPEPWLTYVAASGLLPVLYMLAGGSVEPVPWLDNLRELLVRRERKQQTKGKPRRRGPGTRVPKF